MKTKLMPLILAAFGLAASGASAQKTESAPVEAAPKPPSELKALAESCAAHKFETLVAVEGRRRPISVKICGKEGQSDSDWLVTLRDSLAKTEGNEQLDLPVREQVMAALKVEISRLEGLAEAGATSATIAVSPEPVWVPEAAPQYSSVPQLPAPRPRLAQSQSNEPTQVRARPRLSIRCALPRETFADCARLERETQMLIRADEDLPPGTSVRFVRGGDARGEVELGSLKKGASLQEKLPGRVCAGVLRGKVEVQVVNKGRVADTLGPFSLYCGS